MFRASNHKSCDLDLRFGLLETAIWGNLLRFGLHDCVFPVEPQGPNGKNINLHKKWGLRRFQKERQKVRKTGVFVQKVC